MSDEAQAEYEKALALYGAAGSDTGILARASRELLAARAVVEAARGAEAWLERMAGRGAEPEAARTLLARALAAYDKVGM